MTRYEKIMNEMTIEQLAKLLITEKTIKDWDDDEYQLYYVSYEDASGYWDEEDAVEAEIEWLKEKV